MEIWLDYFVTYMTIGTRFGYEDGDQKRKGWHIENFPWVEERDEAWICNDHSSIGVTYHRYLLLWSQQRMEHLATCQYQSTFTVCHIIFPEAFILASVSPKLDTFAMALILLIPRT